MPGGAAFLEASHPVLRDHMHQAGRRANWQAGNQAGGLADKLAGGQAGRRAGRWLGRQTSRQAGKQLGRQTSRRASRHAGRRLGRRNSRQDSRCAVHRGRQAQQQRAGSREAEERREHSSRLGVSRDIRWIGGGGGGCSKEQVIWLVQPQQANEMAKRAWPFAAS